MAQCISRRAARSRRPEKLKEDLAQVPFCFACAARIARRVAPRVGDEKVFSVSLVAGARQQNYPMVAL